jgi:surface carbohydrate biosynthesis protein
VNDKKLKVLCFQNTDSGRDVEMMLPVQYFAERFLNCTFEHVVIRDIFAIYRKKPDIVFLPNTIGSKLYFTIAKLSHEQGIPVFALISEGNFRTDGTFNYWGYNSDRKFFQEYVCCWSKRTADFLKIEVPESADKTVITGAAGFDRYKIYEFMKKDDFLKKYEKTNYKKVILYAGWGFGKLQHTRGRMELKHFFKDDPDERLKWVEEQRDKVYEILKSAAENNKDILFVLKKHPQESSPEIMRELLNEMNRLKDHENVIYLSEEESVHDLISVSDLLLCFESTTALETWLMGKETIFINPDPNFNRDELYKGSIMVTNYAELQNHINIFYEKGTMPEFNAPEKIKKREKIAENTIGFSDGMNHIRAGYYFQKVTDKIRDEKPKIRYKFRLFDVIIYLSFVLSRPFYVKSFFKKTYKLKKIVWVYENWELNIGVAKLYKKYTVYLDKFYKERNVEEKYSDGSLFQSLIKNS